MNATRIRFDSFLHTAPPTIVIKPDVPRFTIVTASKAYLEATHKTLDELTGAGVLEIFPEKWMDDDQQIVLTLEASLTEAVTSRQQTVMPVHRYDIFNSITGKWETRYWTITNSPILNEEGEVECIVHIAQDCTTTYNLAKQEKLALEVTQAQRKQLHESFEQAPVGIGLLTGRELKIEFGNDIILRVLGKTKSIIGSTVAQSIPELEGQPFLKILDKVYTSGQTYYGNSMPAMFKQDNQLAQGYYDFIYHPFTNDEGITSGIMVIGIDVTEQVTTRIELEKSIEQKNRIEESLRQNEARLAESESIFRGLFEQAPLGMCLLRGHNQVIEAVNDNILKIWGRTREEVIGLPQRIARPEMLDQPMLGWIDDVFATGETRTNTDLKVKLYNSDGNLRDAIVNSVYQPIANADGNVIGVLMITNEVTEQYLTRRQAEHIQDMFKLAVESAALGTWYHEVEQNKFTPSVRLKELFGYLPDEEMTYQGALSQIREDYRNTTLDAIREGYSRNGSYDLEFPIIGYHNKQLRWVKATGKVYPATGGKYKQFSGTVLDITERKLDDIRKNDFIAMASHELKTPLTSMKAYLQVLQLTADIQKVSIDKNLLSKADLQINKMTNLINNFLNVSRLEAGKIHLEKTSFPIDELIKEVTEDMSLTIKDHVLVYTACHSSFVYADYEKIGQVINNFISNAVKYSQRGTKIHIHCFKNQDSVQISVQDEGRGIAPHDKERLFDRFYRVETKDNAIVSGFGIGLYLSAEIVYRHNGNIWVDSEENKGSTFHFSLPLN